MLAGSINTNVDALFALNALQNTSNSTSTLEQELSSGLAINGPQDNPAGYIAAQGFQTQIGGTTQAISNANQAISLVQTANGGITQQVTILQQIRDVAAQAANGTNDTQELQSLQGVVAQLQTQVSTIAQQTNFGGFTLLDGSVNGLQLQVGAFEGQTQTLSIGSTLANAIGVSQSTAATGAGGIYIVDGSGSGGVGDKTGNSYAITTGGTGAFTAGSVSDLRLRRDQDDHQHRDGICRRRRQFGQRRHAKHQRHRGRQYQRRLYRHVGVHLLHARQRQ